MSTDFLDVIREIRNCAIHTNSGDITKQQKVDKDLMEVVDIVFAELLNKNYEQPLRSKQN